MEASGPGVKHVENETKSTSIRTTKDGRKLSYQLNVLQQPSRARACGSGAKCKFFICCLSSMHHAHKQ